ncbi:MAG: NAD(P)H-dependent oxidoreductase subunit E [Thermoanaerobaculaceae bacterium]|nr:NAD(P)H-dependent oxidoreductase subunit E [Thermoanaerobaculaceae bacterium]
MSTRPIVAVPPEALRIVTFDAAMEASIAELLPRYPTRRAAVLPVLWLCQERFGWISPGVVRAVAARLGESPAFVEGVVSFYTMYQTAPPARYVLQVCTTLSCAWCGGRELVAHLKERLGISFGEKTPDGMFQLVGVQCLGACGTAPVVQINDDYYENLDVAKLDAILDELAGRS